MQPAGMTPANVPLTIYTGTTFGPVTLTCRDAEGVLVDLTGWTAYAEVRKTEGGPVIVDLEPVITDAGGGVVTLGLSKEDTAALPVGGYLWDILLQRPTGERLGPYVAGKVSIKKPITQP